MFFSIGNVKYLFDKYNSLLIIKLVHKNCGLVYRGFNYILGNYIELSSGYWWVTLLAVIIFLIRTIFQNFCLF